MYKLAKYLAQILKLLRQSQYTIKSSKSFMKTVKKQKIPPGYQMVSLDAVSLFTNVPLEETIDIIVKIINDTLALKINTLTLNSKIFAQTDHVALGPVLANIFMVELEQNIIPTLWKR